MILQLNRLNETLEKWQTKAVYHLDVYGPNVKGKEVKMGALGRLMYLHDSCKLEVKAWSDSGKEIGGFDYYANDAESHLGLLIVTNRIKKFVSDLEADKERDFKWTESRFVNTGVTSAPQEEVQMPSYPYTCKVDAINLKALADGMFQQWANWFNAFRRMAMNVHHDGINKTVTAKFEAEMWNNWVRQASEEKFRYVSCFIPGRVAVPSGTASVHLCPVCGGKGKLTECKESSTDASRLTVICHGCYGLGWVTVSNPQPPE